MKLRIKLLTTQFYKNSLSLMETKIISLKIKGVYYVNKPNKPIFKNTISCYAVHTNNEI